MKKITSVTGWTVPEPTACICLDEWKDSTIVGCKSQACIPVRCYDLATARLLERAIHHCQSKHVGTLDWWAERRRIATALAKKEPSHE